MIIPWSLSFVLDLIPSKRKKKKCSHIKYQQLHLWDFPEILQKDFSDNQTIINKFLEKTIRAYYLFFLFIDTMIFLESRLL